MSNQTEQPTRPAMQGDKEQLKKQFDAVKAICDAVLESVKVAGPLGAPGGMIYAAMASNGISLENFHKIMGILVNAGRVEFRGQCYFYVEGK